MRVSIFLLSFFWTSCLLFKRKSSIDEEKMLSNQVECPIYVKQSLSAWKEIEDNDPETPEFICGEIEVPFLYADRSLNKIKLNYFYIFPKSYPDHKNLPAPFVMSQGGPGGSSLKLYLHTRNRFSNIANEHGLFAFEYRGTEHSSVPLECNLLTYDQCASFWRKRFDMRGFNSREFASDIVTLMEMTGIQHYWFYGVSYGSLIGQHLLRDHRSVGLKGMVLDGVVPYAHHDWPQQEAVWAVTNRLSKLCFSNEDCVNTYRFLSEFHKTQEFKSFKVSALRHELFSIFDRYDEFYEKKEFLQRINDKIKEDKKEMIGPYNRIQKAGVEDMVFVAVICNETLVKSPYIEDYITREVCDKILPDGSALMVEKPIANRKVPVLLLSGHYDVRTNSELADRIIQEKKIEHLQSVTVNAGHGIFFSHRYGPDIVEYFLKDPMGTLEHWSETQELMNDP